MLKHSVLAWTKRRKFKVLDAELKIGPRDIVYVTGDSGSGKSVLLRAIRKDLGDEAIDLPEICIEADKPLIETVGATVEEGLDLLSRVGLKRRFSFPAHIQSAERRAEISLSHRKVDRKRKAVVAYG